MAQERITKGDGDLSSPTDAENGEAILVGLDADGSVVWSWYSNEPGLKTIPFTSAPPNVVTIELRLIGARGGGGGSGKTTSRPDRTKR